MNKKVGEPKRKMSLNPLNFREAVSAILKVKPEPKKATGKKRPHER